MIEGTTNVTKHRARMDREVRPTGDLTEPPGDLTDAQKVLWNYAIGHAPRGLLKMLDASVLKVWVVAAEIHGRVAQQLGQGTLGRLISQTPNGTWTQNALLPILNRQAIIMVKAAEQLGFTPAARGRVLGDQKTNADPNDEFFAS